MSEPMRKFPDHVAVDAVIWKHSDPVVVEAFVTEAHRDFVALLIKGEVFGSTHIVAKSEAVHESTATTRDKLLAEIGSVEMTDSARVAVKAIIDKHLGRQP